MTTAIELTYDTFADRIDATWMLQWPDAGAPFPARLVECVTTADRPAEFSVLFRAGPDAPAEQGCFLLSAADVEPTPIFLVPLAHGPEGTDYQAVFNRATPGDSAPNNVEAELA